MSATNRGSARIAQDKYQTPPSAIRSMLDRINEDLIYTSFEPCRGEGNIFDLMPGAHKLWREISEGMDYLKWGLGAGTAVDLTITNPPFSLAMEFLVKSLAERSLLVVYLLRLNFLGSGKRAIFWQERQPTHLYVLSKRPSFINGRTDATEYAWFVWDRSGGRLIKDLPGIYVI